MKVTTRIGSTLLFIAFALACLVFVIVCALGLKQDAGVTWAETEGTIVNIITDYNASTEDYDHDVYVDYTVDGKEYNDVKYNSYSSTMRIGDTVKVNYNVEDPLEIQSPGTQTWLIILIIACSIGTIFFFWKAFRTFFH